MVTVVISTGAGNRVVSVAIFDQVQFDMSEFDENRVVFDKTITLKVK